MLRMNQYRRPAIGLVELMVAMALCIGIMWILAEAFKTGLDMTRELRSTTTMVNQIDGARAIMTYDLSKDHFPRDDNRPGGGTKLSHQRYDWLNNTTGQNAWSPPKAGFFRILSPPPTIQAVDSDGFSMNTATTCALHFTSILPPAEKNLYTAKVNGVTYTSRAAEIAYFLHSKGQQTPGGSALFSLHRRQRLIALSNDEVNQLKPALRMPGGDEFAQQVAGVSNTDPNLIRVETLETIRDPARRLVIDSTTMPGGAGNPPIFGTGHPLEGTDLLLTNVLSFEVQVDWTPSGVPGCTFAPRTNAAGNWDAPFDALALAGNTGNNSQARYQTQTTGTFDTWYPSPTWNSFVPPTAETLPLAVRVKQLRVVIRIFDSKTQQTRQSTFVVEQ